MMPQTIAIPTDFSISSLSLLKVALQHYPEEPLRILFVHGYVPGDSVSDLLFYSERRVIAERESPDFREACDVLRNKSGKRSLSIHSTLFTGRTLHTFNTFLESNRVDRVVVPSNGLPNGNDSCGLYLYDFLQRCNAEKLWVEWEAKPVLPEHNRLAELFAL